MKITLLTGQIYDISEAVGMNIKVIPSRSGRKISLRIDAKERIPVLSVPRFCSRKRAISFVNENMDWLIENLSKIPPQKKFSDGMRFLLFGEEVIIKHSPQQKRGTWLENNVLYVSGSAEFLHRRVRDYIKKTAAAKFYAQSAELAAKIGQKLSGVSIKDTKSRWGSCSTLHHINYSWRIALAPRSVIDYLIAHEVAHLKHQNHSSAFWNCVAELNADWQSGYSWLKQNGKTLYKYD